MVRASALTSLLFWDSLQEMFNHCWQLLINSNAKPSNYMVSFDAKGIILFLGPREEMQLPNLSRRLPATLRSLRHPSEKETNTPCLGKTFQI